MKDFLQAAEEQLILNKDKDLILTELSDHVETKIEFFESIGYSEEASTEKANEAMGNGEVIGQRLDMIHRSNTKFKKAIISGIFVINISLAFYNEVPTGNDPFSLLFFWALLVFASDLIFTADAIRLKSNRISGALIVASLFPILSHNYMLAYPICNLIVHNTYSAYEASYLLSIAITALLSVLIIIPNALNIYHCEQIKKLKNTRKQNTISRFMRNACVIIAISSIVLSVPYNMLNDRVCEEQAEIRNELIGFALDTAGKFNYNEWDELAEYLENCEYDFEYFTHNYQNEPGGETYTYESYRYSKGNWAVRFYRSDEEENEGYNISSETDLSDDYSLKYLYTTNEETDELIKKIGDPEVGPGNAMGRSAQEIRNAFDGFDLDGIYVTKQDDGSIYRYYWRLPKTYFGCHTRYEFYCDTDDICYYYELP